MKNLLLGFLFSCLSCVAIFAQAPVNIPLQKLAPNGQSSSQQNANWTDFYLPDRGMVTSEGVEFRRAGADMLGHGTPKSITNRLAPVSVFNGPNGPILNSLNDARNLPLSENGKLLTPDGWEVEFRIPTNPAGAGICATPVPEVILPEARVMVNCPFVVPCDNPVNRDANIPTAVQPIKFVKLNWIVLRSTSGGATSNIDQTRVDQLMTEVNADFAPFRIQFCSDPVTFATDDTHYSLNVGSEDGSLKNTHGTTPNDHMNVYVVGNITNPSAGGYARFPYDPFGGLNIRGGVVLSRSNMFTGTHTLAHEIGHTFGLHHTFRGVDEVTPCTACYEGRDLASGASSGGDTEGDWCFDTNPHPTNANICGDNGTDGCAPGLPWLNSPVNNHMSYSFCTTQFTPQQAGRMHCMMDTYLQPWLNFGGATCGALPPVADFSGTPTFWQAPMTVSFTDLSVPASTITNWTWNFDVVGIGGATPATFSGGPGVGNLPPQVVYTLCDTTYTVSLTVTNSNGSDTETKVGYITAFCPANGCDTLDQHWTTPVSTPSIFTFAANDFVTGIPAPTLNGPTLQPIGLYERYITPIPGTTTVGAMNIGLGNYVDADSDMVMQTVIYNCDAAGLPIGAPLGGVAGINPGADLAVPGAGFFLEYDIPHNKVVIDSPSFLVGVEIFPGDLTDGLIVVSSANGQGQAQGLNFVNSNSFGYINYNTFVGIDFDLDIKPTLGPAATEFFINGLGAFVGCDTTILVLTDSALFHPCMTSVQVVSAYNGTITDTTLAGVDTLLLLYTRAGPDTITFRSINECGRRDTITYFLSYPFDTTPNPVDFIMNMVNPICAGTAITFTGSPNGAADYTWDFGDGTVVSSGVASTQNHTYALPGLYYVSLTVTDPSLCASTETKLDFVEIIDCTVNAPIAGFDPQPDTGCVTLPFMFVDTSQAVPDPPTSWFWAFDDGSFSILQNPSHTYNTPGTYNVMLVAGNAGGTDTIFYQIEVIGLPCSLPIETLLRANPVGNSVVLNWETPSDNNRSDFDIERSYDGANFDKLGQVSWAEATAPHLYSYIDATAELNRTIYYRLQEISQNGDTDYSNVVTARLGATDTDWLIVYPNPVRDQRTLNVDAFLLDSDNLSFQMFDALGRSVFETQRVFDAGIGRLVIETETLPSGTYFLRVTSAKGVQVQKIVIE